MHRKTLAGLPAADFLRRYWQKKPLLARAALPQCTRLITREELFTLAGRDDLESRLVTRAHGRWQVAHGPFSWRRLSRLPHSGWTLLVQGVNHVVPAARDLLREFAFIPYARFDDVMVSYAPPGGGVGPHFDSYDVFLLQVAGTRRWDISRQRDLSLIENAPLKLLRRFRAQRRWRVGPGDLIYLPPRIAHDGVAVSECMTASVGFRAPSAQELGLRFLEFLQDRLQLDGMYADPDLKPADHPARIGNEMVRRMRSMLDRIDWSASDVLEFIGCYLTEPKPHVFFTPPRPALTAAAFARRAARCGIELSGKTQMLYHGTRIFVNGERVDAGPRAAALLMRLADHRRLAPPLALDSEAASALYQWYRAGYIELSRAAGKT
jgi:50S ribosomal protein L16 3-hydroxylase